MSDPSLAIISGVAPGTSGTGWLMRGLLGEINSAQLPIGVLHRLEKRSCRGLTLLLPGNLSARIAFVLDQLTFGPRALAAAARADQVLLMHPQTLGHGLFARLMGARAFSWTYVLDSYFFCKAGYNHLPSEDSPCLRCLGTRGEPASVQGCGDAFAAGPFVPSLREWVAAGRLGLIAQCPSQAALLRRHFGPEAKIKVVPLHVPHLEVTHRAERPSRPRPLAVFHGSTHPAKGVGLAVALARQMPDWDLMIPATACDARRLLKNHGAPPPNVHFQPITWETGLAEAVAEADAVLCPSLWSAPVEGALLKSLAANGVVLACPHETSFASELSAGSFIPLLPDRVADAAASLRLVQRDPAAGAALRAAAASFVSEYVGRSRNMAGALLAACD